MTVSEDFNRVMEVLNKCTDTKTTSTDTKIAFTAIMNLRHIWREKSLKYYDLTKMKIPNEHGTYIGQFKFTEKERLDYNNNREDDSSRIFISDIGELAFGNFIRNEPKRICWFKRLLKKIAENTSIPMNILINQVLEEFGIELSLLPNSNYPEYWIVFPTSLRGQPRTVLSGPLSENQIDELVKIDYDIVSKDVCRKFEDLKLKLKSTDIKELY